ncbi:Tsa antioxidant enzyme domain protein, partial [Coniochaeta hoffmannii]
MFSSLTTKIALRKLGLNSDALNFSSPTAAPDPPKPKKLTKNAPPGTVPGLDEDDSSSKWPAWMTVKSLPLTVQPWLSPPPPPIPVAAECPKPGDLAPLDRDRKLTFGGGKKVLVVFLRCVGCAFAQKTFLALRAIANKYPTTLSCIAISHSSPAATQKWIDLVGGAWNVSVVIDEDRSLYAAWGLGLGSVWYVLNPTSQVQGWKEKGWLGASVAGAITRTGTAGMGRSTLDAEREGRRMGEKG